MRLMTQLLACLVLAALIQPSKADLLGYWSANTTEGKGETLINDQGNRDLDGELIETAYTGDKGGHTGQPGDYALEFEGTDEDYVVIPPTEETFDEITLTAWVNGFPNGAWAGIVVSRDPGGQTLYMGFSGDTNNLAYVWNNNSNQTWGWPSEVPVPEEEWTFVALTVNEEVATLYSGAKGEDLEFNENEIEHFSQDNFTEWRLAEDDCCGTERNFSGLMDDVSIWNQALTLEELSLLHSGERTPLTLFNPGVSGDFNGNGSIDVEDADLLATGMQANDAAFDLNSDGNVDSVDRGIWVRDLANTWFGDANFDGEFNSSDLVSVFQAGLFESGQPASWAQGDWSGDGIFNSTDFVVAFQDGGFELGPRQAAAASVPEPASIVLLGLGVICMLRRRSQ